MSLKTKIEYRSNVKHANKVIYAEEVIDAYGKTIAYRVIRDKAIRHGGAEYFWYSHEYTTLFTTDSKDKAIAACDEEREKLINTLMTYYYNSTYCQKIH